MNRTKLSVQRPEFTIFAKNQRLVQMSESVTIVKNQPFAQMLVLCNNCKEPTFRTKVGIYIAKPDQIIHFLKKLVNSKSWTRIFVLSSFLNYPAPRNRTVRKVLCIIRTFRITQLREAGQFEKFFASSALFE